MKTRMLRLPGIFVAFLVALVTTPVIARIANAQADEGQAKIAEDAFIYGFPMVMNYAVFHEYFVDKSSSAVQGAAQSDLERAERVHVQGHGHRHA